MSPCGGTFRDTILLTNKIRLQIQFYCSMRIDRRFKRNSGKPQQPRSDVTIVSVIHPNITVFLAEHDSSQNQCW